MRLRIAAALAGVTLLSGCTWGHGDGTPVGAPSPLGQRDVHSVRGPAFAGDAATFQLVNGSDAVRVRLGDLGGDLYEISTGDDSRLAPTVDVDGTTVVAGLHDTGRPGPAVVTAVLSDDVRWEVRLSGGAADESVDLTGGPGGAIVFSSGTTRAEATLPAADGTQRVQMSGGAGEMLVRLSGNEPARVAARGGAASVTVDGKTHTGVAGGSVWTPDGWNSATNRYDIDATAGVSTLTVERLP